ncbi:hypothetical protein [Streptomyces sp. SM11]|uniref:hypothetical protein n=1 Tax=Streptomyces sp. SM11 TaxID=565557 RepID=UPI0021561899|nr:hypothetical protein [Streptomyces sp. SM11]
MGNSNGRVEHVTERALTATPAPRNEMTRKACSSQETDGLDRQLPVTLCIEGVALSDVGRSLNRF